MVFQTSQCPGAPGGHKLLDNPASHMQGPPGSRLPQPGQPQLPPRTFQILVPSFWVPLFFESIKYFHPLDVFLRLFMALTPALSSPFLPLKTLFEEFIHFL